MARTVAESARVANVIACVNSSSDRGHADTGQFALKLWCLQGLFKRLAIEWQLDFAVSGAWPGLALIQTGLVFSRRLELRLQSAFPADNREYYEFRFTQSWRSALGGAQRQRFCCGRLYPDDVLSESRVRRELAEKALLLGLASADAWERHEKKRPKETQGTAQNL